MTKFCANGHSVDGNNAAPYFARGKRRERCRQCMRDRDRKYYRRDRNPNPRKLQYHGQSASQMYEVWAQMNRRCDSPGNKDYKYYGARGVIVCERWKVFNNFVSDMGERPPGMTVDRVNPDGNYEPSNCKWATRAEQSRNRRNVRRK